MSSPYLPPELEHSIFLLTYQDSHREGKNLILVAKRVYEWLTPHIFNIFMLTRSQIEKEISETIYQKHGHHARHLVIDSNELRSRLPLFPNVTNLAFWASYDPIYLPSLLQMPLERISVGSTMSSPDVFQLLAKVTHLDYIPDFPSDDISMRSVLYLPKLTHLCVLHRLPQASLELFLDKERCPELRVVAIWYYGHGTAEPEMFGSSHQLDDKRIVSIKCNSLKDWEIGARGGVDMWKLAEKLVAEKSANQVDVLGI